MLGLALQMRFLLRPSDCSTTSTTPTLGLGERGGLEAGGVNHSLDGRGVDTEARSGILKGGGPEGPVASFLRNRLQRYSCGMRLRSSCTGVPTFTGL